MAVLRVNININKYQCFNLNDLYPLIVFLKKYISLWYSKNMQRELKFFCYYNFYRDQMIKMLKI